MSGALVGDNCRAGCTTRNHRSWGECARAANVRQMWLGGTGPSLSDHKAFNRTNESYRQALADGLAPAGVNDRAIRAAYDLSE